jgi:hypothetical protein
VSGTPAAPRAAPATAAHIPAADASPVLASLTGAPAPDSGVMNPAFVCLAVLGVWGLALAALTLCRLARRGRTPASPTVPAPGGEDGALCWTPPGRTRLARLSVLRI